MGPKPKRFTGGRSLDSIKRERAANVKLDQEKQRSSTTKKTERVAAHGMGRRMVLPGMGGKSLDELLAEARKRGDAEREANAAANGGTPPVQGFKKPPRPGRRKRKNKRRLAEAELSF